MLAGFMWQAVVNIVIGLGVPKMLGIFSLAVNLFASQKWLFHELAWSHLMQMYQHHKKLTYKRRRTIKNRAGLWNMSTFHLS